MRALMLHGPGDLRLEDVPEPEPGAGEVVVALDLAMTCATDAKILRAGRHPALPATPCRVGHEGTGVVVAVGSGVVWPAVGDAVVFANSAPCGHCRACGRGRLSLCSDLEYLWGTFAERVVIPARIVATNVLERPTKLDPRIAPMIEPLACAIRAVQISRAAAGDSAIILGGGVQGQFLTALLAERGCSVTLCDPHDDRRERARAFGAEHVADAPRDEAGIARVRRETPGGAGADIVFEAVGRPDVWQAAVALAAPGAEVNFYGGCPVGSTVTLPTEPLHYRELVLQGSYHHTPDAVRSALDMLCRAALPFGELVGEPVGLDEVANVLADSGPKRPVVLT